MIRLITLILLLEGGNVNALDRFNQRDPFNFLPHATHATIKNSKSLLATWSLEQLQFIGVIRNSAVIWALIKSPDGLVTHVQLGDYLGNGDSRVIKIQQATLQLQQNSLAVGQAAPKIVSLALSHGSHS